MPETLRVIHNTCFQVPSCTLVALNIWHHKLRTQYQKWLFGQDETSS